MVEDCAFEFPWNVHLLAHSLFRLHDCKQIDEIKNSDHQRPATRYIQTDYGTLRNTAREIKKIKIKRLERGVRFAFQVFP